MPENSYRRERRERCLFSLSSSLPSFPSVKVPILVALLLLCSLRARSQLKLHDFKLAVPFAQTNAATVRITRPKTVLNAGEARPLTNDLYEAEIVRIENYQQDGKTNLIVRTPACLFDTANSIAFSTNRIELESPNGLHIEGRGFICYLTNFNLIISNDVRTRVQQRLLQTAPEVSGARLQTNQSLGTNIAMTVTANQFDLNFPSNIITYVGGVLVDHTQMKLESARLTVNRTTNGTLEQVVAEREVRITNKVDHSRATGDLAIYRLAPVETVELTGHAQWNDDQRQSRAEHFDFDLKQRHLRAQGKAWMSLPRQSIAQPELGKHQATNIVAQNPVEITAEMIDLQMPTTNHPSRKLAAEKGVVIISPADQSRALAEKAVFDEGTGLAELTGNAAWQAGDRLAKGQLLRYNRTNGVFFAERDAYLKMPVSALAAMSTNKPSATTNAVPPQFVEVRCREYTYTSNSLVFRDNVRGQLLEGATPRGNIQCSWLQLRFTNQLESASATGRVRLEQLPNVAPSPRPFPPMGEREKTSRRVAKILHCESLDIKMQPGGAVERLVAETNVFAEQLEWRGTNSAPFRSLFTADQVVADFFPHTNHVQEGVATGNVSIFQEGRIANGERALYHGTHDLVELFGHPTAELPEGKITDAEVLVWDRRQNKLAGRKIKGQGEAHSGRTNLVSPLSR